MDLIYWIIVIAWALFAIAGTRVPTLAPYGWWPAFILFVILGLKVIGAPH